MAVNHVSNINQVILYIIFFVRRCYLDWDDNERMECSKELIALLRRALLEERREWGIKGKYWGLFRRIIAMFQYLGGDEIENISHFLAESPFLFVFSEYFDAADTLYLKDDMVLTMMNALSNDIHRGIVGCAIYDRCRIASQDMIRSIVCEKMNELPYWSLSRGLFTGAVVYDEKMYAVIGREIERVYEDRPFFIDEDSENSPVFTIMRLFKWGRITEYELRSFEQYCTKSAFLTFMIYPDLFPAEMIREEWGEILIHPKYRKYSGYRL